MKRCQALLAILLVQCLASSAASAAGAESVTLEERHGVQGMLYHIEGNFDVAASRSQVWGVLTDYSALKGVVSSMQASCVLSRDGNTAVVEQVALGRFLFFRKSIRLLLKVVEVPESLVTFSEVSAQPFRIYGGSWALAEAGDDVAVTYRLDVSQADMAPPFLERGLFRDNALSLLKELRAEIVRRAALPAPVQKRTAP